MKISLTLISVSIDIACSGYSTNWLLSKDNELKVAFTPIKAFSSMFFILFLSKLIAVRDCISDKNLGSRYSILFWARSKNASTFNRCIAFGIVFSSHACKFKFFSVPSSPLNARSDMFNLLSDSFNVVRGKPEMKTKVNNIL